jgi:hypothetical protein
MRRTILFSVSLFIIALFITISCNKKEFRGCNSSKHQLTCTIDGVDFVSDIDSCTYDSVNHFIVIRALDTSINASLVFTITHALQDMEIVLAPTDSFYRGKLVGVIGGKYFDSKYGNFGMSVNGSELCGQFFSSDNVSKTNVSIGQFSKVPWKYKW